MLLVNAVLSAKGQAGAQDILQTALRNILLPDPWAECRLLEDMSTSWPQNLEREPYLEIGCMHVGLSARSEMKSS